MAPIIHIETVIPFHKYLCSRILQRELIVEKSGSVALDKIGFIIVRSTYTSTSSIMQFILESSDADLPVYAAAQRPSNPEPLDSMLRRHFAEVFTGQCLQCRA